jgi:hypothetical protein
VTLPAVPALPAVAAGAGLMVVLAVVNGYAKAYSP